MAHLVEVAEEELLLYLVEEVVALEEGEEAVEEGPYLCKEQGQMGTNARQPLLFVVMCVSSLSKHEDCH